MRFPATDLKISLCVISVQEPCTRLRDFSLFESNQVTSGPIQPPSQWLLGASMYMTTHFDVVLVLIMNSVITSPPYMPLPSLCLILGQCPKTVLPEDSGHTWTEIGNIWILTLYGFVGYTYKQNAEDIFYH